MMIALVLHVQDNLGLNAQVYGLILASGAVGGILGGWLGGPIIRLFGPSRSAQLALLASAPIFLAIAYVPGPVSLGLTLALFEFFGLIWNTVSVSYRQRAIPDALLGRVNSLYRLFAWGMMPIGLILSGLIARGVQSVVARDTAVMMPILVAALGAFMLAFVGWKALGRGFGAE